MRTPDEKKAKLRAANREAKRAPAMNAISDNPVAIPSPLIKTAEAAALATEHGGQLGVVRCALNRGRHVFVLTCQDGTKAAYSDTPEKFSPAALAEVVTLLAHPSSTFNPTPQ